MEQRLLSVRETCTFLGIRKTKLYDLFRQGLLEKTKLGNKTLVPTDSAEALIFRLREEAQKKTNS